MACDIQHEGHYFRSLRPDEVDKLELEAKLEAKDPRRKPPSDSEERTEMIQEHIKYGSKQSYRSPWLSLTADLDVALAFAGPVSRVAFLKTKDLDKEKSAMEVKRLDKEYLRSVLTEKDAVARSRRSDEVLVYQGLRCAKLLEIKLVEERAVRTLAPGFEDDDSQKFPQLDALPRATEAIGGPNKRMFRIDINGKIWIALLPRPNYSLDKKVLFGSELVQLARHQGGEYTFFPVHALNYIAPCIKSLHIDLFYYKTIGKKLTTFPVCNPLHLPLPGSKTCALCSPLHFQAIHNPSRGHL